MSENYTTNNITYPKKEENIQKLWNQNNIFQKTLQKNSNNKKFIFYDNKCI